jgi:hypothetical protein
MNLKLRWIARTAVAAAYVILFGEVFLRLFAPQPILPRYVTAAPWGVRMNTPNSVYRQWTPEVDVQIRINGQGLRADHDFPEAKPPHSCRIALLGDSYFVGFESSLENSFAQRLEDRLRQDGYDAEVLNFAVSGHGTAEMLLTYDGYARKFDPDLVVVQWHRSDFNDNARSGLFQIKEDGKLHPLSPTYLPGTRLQAIFLSSAAYRWVAENSQLYNALRDKTARMVKRLLLAIRGRSGSTDPEGESDAPSLLTPQVALSTAIIQELRRHVEAAGDRFMMVEIPRRLSRQTFESGILPLPAALTRDPAFVSSFIVFNAAAGPDTKLFTEKGNFHLTALGNRLLGDLVAKHVEVEPFAGRCKFHGTKVKR